MQITMFYSQPISMPQRTIHKCTTKETKTKYLNKKNQFIQSTLRDELVFLIKSYKKNGINLFYFKHGTICWQSVNWSNGISAYMVFKSVFQTIEKYIRENNIKGKLGFELSGLKKLDTVFEYMLNRNGFNTLIEDKILFANS